VERRTSGAGVPQWQSFFDNLNAVRDSKDVDEESFTHQWRGQNSDWGLGAVD